MKNCLGIISFSNDLDKNFGTLCNHRPAAMLPFGGRYRLIDFFLSNMVNHEITTIGVFTGTKIRSVMDHIGSGKPWDLNRRFNGLFVFPPLYDDYTAKSLGNINLFHTNEPFFRNSSEENMFICNTSMLYKADLECAYDYFKETEADVTMIYKKVKDPGGRFINCDKISIKEDGTLDHLGTNLGTEESFNLFLGSVFIKKSFYLKIVRDAIETGTANYLKEALLNNRRKYKFNTFEHEGHVESIRNVKNYFDANMNLLDSEIYKELFSNYGTVYTKTKDEPSTFYKDEAKVSNSLIANGCILDGNIQNSVIFRGVKIGKNAIVKNSILMQKAVVEEGAVIVNAIVDKYTRIEKGVEVIGNQTVPYVVEKNLRIGKEDK
jgi:glucose-1-phosphate adenylyltransferase